MPLYSFADLHRLRARITRFLRSTGLASSSWIKEDEGVSAPSPGVMPRPHLAQIYVLNAGQACPRQLGRHGRPPPWRVGVEDMLNCL